MHVHLDPLGGIAGDMFIAAVLDAWPEWREALPATLDQAGLPPGWAAQISRRQQHAIQGQHFRLRLPDDPAQRRTPSGRFAVIRDRIGNSPLADGVKRHAVGIFTLLAEAEAAIHGVAVDDVHFHELADWDSVADIIGAAWLIDRIAASAWSVGPLPLGGGEVQTAHGPLPLPAPATAKLLEGFEVTDDGIAGERVTPTGAAILRYLNPQPRAGFSGRLQRSGYGLGTRELPGKANVLRLLAFTAGDARAESVAVVTFDIDDQSPEDLALALDHLRAETGVLDVLQIPAVGKKGRLTAQVQLLCRPEVLEAVRQRCFAETTTLGLRWRTEQRAVLPRRLSDQQGLTVKTADRPDRTVTAKADIDGVAELDSHHQRQQQRGAAEQAALTDHREPDHD